jgi:hypothetical protein
MIRACRGTIHSQCRAGRSSSYRVKQLQTSLLAGGLEGRQCAGGGHHSSSRWWWQSVIAQVVVLSAGGGSLCLWRPWMVTCMRRWTATPGTRIECKGVVVLPGMVPAAELPANRLLVATLWGRHYGCDAVGLALRL